MYMGLHTITPLPFILESTYARYHCVLAAIMRTSHTIALYPRTRTYFMQLRFSQSALVNNANTSVAPNLAKGSRRPSPEV